MKVLTVETLLEFIRAFLSDKTLFKHVREFVFRYYESESDCELDHVLDITFPVLAPYLEYEEAFGDLHREENIRRLYKILQSREFVLKEHIVFALNYKKLKELHGKQESQLLSKRGYENQLKKLSPVNFDFEKLEIWSESHKNLEHMDMSIMI